MVKKIAFWMLIILVIGVSILSLVIMYTDNPYLLNIDSGQVTAPPLDLSDVWIVQKGSVIQERNLEAVIGPSDESALSVITINAKPANTTILCSPWKILTSGEIIAKTPAKTYKVDSDVRLIKIEQDTGTTTLYFLDYDKLTAMVRIPVELMKMNLYEEKITLRFGDSTFDAQVEYIDYLAVDNAVSAILRYTDPEKELFPGIRISATLVTGRREDVLVVPLRYVEKMPEGKYRVYLLQGEAATERYIEIGLTDGNFVEVVKGITLDDKLICPDFERSMAYEQEAIHDQGK